MSIKSYQTFKHSQTNPQPKPQSSQQQKVIVVYGRPETETTIEDGGRGVLKLINFDIRRDNKVYPIDIKACWYNGKPYIVIGNAFSIERQIPDVDFIPIYVNVNKWRKSSKSGLLEDFKPITLGNSEIQLKIKNNDYELEFEISVKLGHTIVSKYINKLPDYALIDLSELYHRAEEAEALPDDFEELIEREDMQDLEVYELKLVEKEESSGVINVIPKHEQH
jgi:hypothetical protein